MAFNKVFHVKNEAELAKVAADIAPCLARGTVLVLEGDLGAGKTAFARALIRHISGDTEREVPSPTFTLVQTYDIPDGEIWHFDLYRLKHPEEVYELGWEDALASGTILMIEWAERISPLLPRFCVRVVIKPEADGTRTITVKA
ncbi:MAG: tRNA (adenosine(37)-N6)-threonylcarbamoyltransferase complex ATPase subunit type 1 TsaE [Proteobacteria bacterium]|nr:tRNA (adenosine(37)-N6)-threonylcarbamoyltransferase complex ATPase subunit type 1 TsaE [Pseudomonadota bacterium]